MLVSWNLLKNFIGLGVTPEKAAERLTLSGAEIEGMTKTAGSLRGVAAARIAALDPHPEKDSLKIARLDTGKGEAVCVTNADNMKQGDRVFYAAPGSVLPDGTELGLRDFFGLSSAGMMLSGAELGLPDLGDPDGLLILPEDAPVGAEAADLYNIADTVLDVSITPNRGDLLSLLGMARELAGLFPGSKLKTPDWFAPLDQTKEWPEAFVEVQLPDPGCFRYHLGLATGIAMGPAPMDVQVALCHMGVRPISNVVDVTNFIMLALGQPLHAFDLRTLPAHEISVRAARDGETLTTLDGKKRSLTGRDMLITSGGKPIALAGVMGGDETGIRDDTETVVIESASFSPVRVGHTARRLGINSEAAFRFSRTVDPTMSGRALAAALNLLSRWCGAAVGYRPASASNETPEPKPVTLTKKRLSTYLSWGDLKESRKILEGFGVRVTEETADSLTCLPPSWRPDITIQEDLIEEIGRFRGYNEAPAELPGKMPRRADIGPEASLASFLRQSLVARGYVEAVTYSFLPEDFPSRLMLPEDDLRAHPLTLANPISRDQIAMRTTLVPGLLGGLRTSIASGWRGEVRLFEQGRVFLRTAPDSADHVEKETLAGLVFNGTDPRNPWQSQTEDFFSVKADLEALIEERGFRAVFSASRQPFSHAGQTAEVRIATPEGEKAIGWLARLKPALEQELDVPGEVFLFEIETAPLAERRRPNLKPASAFPASLRDISMLAPAERTQAEVEADIRSVVAESAGRDILEGLRLFDVYSGKGIPENCRSLAYSLTYRASDRTLKDAEVDAIHWKVRDGLKQKGYNMR